MKEEEFYMLHAIHLAEKGRNSASPNPLVGAVIVKNGRIIGEGYHRKYGNPHAEVIAIESAGEDVYGSTMYVTLEPCIHYGKTPPCVDRIIEAGIKEVIIGMLDPNPEVYGRGIEKLRKHGIKVKTGVLEKSIEEQNKGYIKHHEKKLPFVILKISLSMDGRLSTEDGESKWISGTDTLEYAHYLRAISDAILVGSGTVRKDDPLLTPRLFPPSKLPLRVVLDSHLKLNPNFKVFNRDAPSMVFTSKEVDPDRVKIFKDKGVEVEMVSKEGKFLSWREILEKLASRGVLYLLIEGGSTVSSTLIESGYVDTLILVYSPRLIGRGKGFTDHVSHGSLNFMQLDIIREEKMGKDTVFWCNVYRNN